MEGLVRKLVESLRAKKVDSLTAVMVLQEAAELARREELPRGAVEEAIRRLAAGTDGIAGTSDDLLPPATVDHLAALLSTGLVGDVVDALSRNLAVPRRWMSCFC